jgi:bifunctional NMN adenylyltransferase/nudix hydrolase
VNNPLDFEARKQMILAEFPDVNVLYVRDQFDDDVWSRKLDDDRRDVLAPGQSAVLYGGRDSFIPHYTGASRRIELQDTRGPLPQRHRRAPRRSGRRATKGSPDFRAGVIWASQARFPTSYQCVDIAPLNEDRTKVLLGRKPNEKQFRFLGGFVRPAQRVAGARRAPRDAEEAASSLARRKYVGSTRVEDWRYRNEPDGIKTALFTGKVLHGRPRPGDDIEEVRWFKL